LGSDHTGGRSAGAQPVLSREPGSGAILGLVTVEPKPTLAERILVVDDEPSIVDAVATVLRYEGFNVSEAPSGRAALALLAGSSFDLVVLDVMLPDLDGFEVTRRMRADGLRTPVLFLTARAETADVVTGLGLGGDDYVTKPVSLAEVVARAKAILRRVGGDVPDRRLSFADLVMDEDTHEVWRGGTPVTLTATEFNLLRLFLLNPRRVLSKDQIINHVWRYDFSGNANIVETYVRYLRRKLDALGPPLIQTIRLVGYVLREPDESGGGPEASTG
jgi:two-component system OmpR family response regulator